MESPSGRPLHRIVRVRIDATAIPPLKSELHHTFIRVPLTSSSSNQAPRITPQSNLQNVRKTQSRFSFFVLNLCRYRCTECRKTIRVYSPVAYKKCPACEAREANADLALARVGKRDGNLATIVRTVWNAAPSIGEKVREIEYEGIIFRKKF